MIVNSLPIRYEEPVFRPPSEAHSLILQLTLGCSWNKCTYCGMYRSKTFETRPVEEIIAEIEVARSHGVETNRVFLADGDALAAPRDALVRVLEAIRQRLPSVRRVGIYGDSRSILGHGERVLSELQQLGLGIIYFGAETGDPETLRQVRKGASVARQLEASRLVLEVGVKVSTMVLLGLGGVRYSEQHARQTGRFLVESAPTYAAALTVTPIPGTELFEDFSNGAFELPDRWGMLNELMWMLDEMERFRGPFYANHASNYLPLRLRLPRDRDGAIGMLSKVISEHDEQYLRPEWARGL
jgi:radical SAM superfamily enzyme YgiQ (UPF0313 family)